MAERCGCGRAECRECRLRALGQARRKYFWTPEMRRELRAAYCGRKGKVSAAIDRLAARTGWPRHAFKTEAIRLGIVTERRRPWTAAEEAALREQLGLVAVSTIARKLGRSVESVESRAERLSLSRRARDGYSVTDLVAATGESEQRVRGWLAKGMLGTVHHGGRVKDDAVARFLRRHPHAYDLRRVDQVWYKAMLFGGGLE